MSFLSKFRIPWRLRGARVEAFCLRCDHYQHRHYGKDKSGHCLSKGCACRRFRARMVVTGHIVSKTKRPDLVIPEAE